MKIIKLEASNFKALRAIEITPDKNVITLTGDNGAGKSSILDAIMAAIAGGKSIPDEPLRRGESKGIIKVDIGGLTILRTLTPSGGALRIEDAKGNTQRSPQAILDALVGNLAFDPLAFSRLKSHEQWEQLRELVGLNFIKLDADRLKAYDERTVVGRELLRQQILLKDIPPSVDDAPDAETSAASVIAEIETVEIRNREVSFLRTKIGETHTVWSGHNAQVLEAETEIKNWQVELENRKKLRASSKVAHEVAITAASGNELRDAAPFKEKLKSLEAENARVREKKKRTALVTGIKKSSDEQDVFTRTIEGIDKTKTQLIADAKFPLPELSFNGTEIVYNDIPFAQASDGEKLRVSVAVGMALNPKLRVIFVRDGSLLDEAGLKTIADLATANDFQVWLEDARSTDPAAIEIVDGAVAKEVA